MNDNCPLCGGDAAYLGSMGRLAHLRCRDCGWTFALAMPEPEVTEFFDTLPMEAAA